MFPKLKNKYILAPMADVSFLAFRKLCRKYGASLAYTPQLSSLAIIRKNPVTLSMLDRREEEGICGVQLFGRNPETLLEAAKIAGKNFDLVDLNFGCPSKKIVAQGYGSALLKEKERIYEIVNTLVKGQEKPVTVKMRSGFKKVEAFSLVKTIEEAGASAITIHGRTQAQGYRGKADWSVIKRVKELVNIPVIGNGDVTDPKQAEKLLTETKCDYAMVGRAAMTNPFIFKQLIEYEKTGKILSQSSKEKFHLFFEWSDMINEDTRTSTIKLMANHFSKEITEGKKFREKITKLKNREEIINEAKNFYASL